MRFHRCGAYRNEDVASLFARVKMDSLSRDVSRKLALMGVEYCRIF